MALKSKPISKTKKTEIGKIPIDWSIEKLDDVIKIIIDRRGITPKKLNSDWVETGLPVISAKNIHGGKLVANDKIRFVDENTYVKWMPEKIKTGDIILTSEAPLGELYHVDDFKEFCLGQRLFAIRCNPKKMDDNFLFYYLSSTLGQHQLSSRESGSTAQGIRQEELRKILVCFPKNFNEVKKIGKILSDLDSKIKNLRKIDKTITQIPHVIFKSWFVDFDGVTEFVDSELGKIPKGWKVDNLKNHINVTHGYAFSGKHIQPNPTNYILLTPGNFLSGGGFKNDKFKYYNGPIVKDYHLDGGDLLVTMTDLSKMGDTLGFPLYVPKHSSKIFLHNQRLGKIIIKSNSYITKHFLYSLFCSVVYRNEILASATGTSVQHTAPERIESFSFVLCDDKNMRKFNQVVDSIIENYFYNEKIIDNLMKTRDEILFKLISGKIRI